MSQTSPEIERAASLAEDLIQAAVDYERSEGIYAKGCRQELSEARAAVEAAILGHAQTPAVPASIEEIAQMIGIEFRNDPWAARRAAERVYNFLDARISVRAKTLARQATTSGLPHCEGQAVECDGGLHTVSDTSTGGNTDRNWVEDAPHENGNYENRCVICEQIFIGHKRRVLCKLCSMNPSDSSPDRGGK